MSHRRMWVVSLVLLTSACALVAGAGQRATLVATTGEREVPTGSKRVLILEVQNLSPTMIAVSKPALPSSWRIERTVHSSGDTQVTRFTGAFSPGLPDGGHEARYSNQRYALIPPGGVFRYVLDLDFYLDEKGTPPLAGIYRATFRYEYTASQDESSLPLFHGSLESNEVTVEIRSSAAGDG